MSLLPDSSKKYSIKGMKSPQHTQVKPVCVSVCACMWFLLAELAAWLVQQGFYKPAA